MALCLPDDAVIALRVENTVFPSGPPIVVVAAIGEAGLKCASSR